MKPVAKFVLITLIIAIAMVYVGAGCGKDKATTPPSTAAKWTILVYCDGNNNLDYTQGGNSYCIQDIQDLESVGSTDQVQIVAMVASLKTGGIAKYYHIEHYPDDLGDNISSTMLENKGTKDMSDPQTLRDFLVYGIQHYPAEKYMVIVDDHGGGWRGACEDEQNGSGTMMSMVDMANAYRGALSATGVSKFDIITYHACLMSMVEVAYEVRTCANYLVASEFVMPMESVLGADIWLQSLVNDPSKSALDLANSISTAVYETGNRKQKYVHMATTDLAQMSRLAAKVDNFATQIHTSAGDYWLEVLVAWLNTNVTAYDDQANVDLREFAIKIKQQPHLQNINLIRDAADSLIAALNGAITITNTNAPGIPRGGLTIYMPYLWAMYDGTNYRRLAFNAVGWANFVEDFIATIEALTSYSLTVNVVGQGTVACNPDQQTYHMNDTVMVTATPASGWNFAGWTGDIQSQSNPVGIIMSANTTITANFTQGQQTTVTINGTVSYPGHALSHPIAFLDTSHSQYIYGILPTPANPSNGSFTIQFDLQGGSLDAYVEAWDDLNNNGSIDQGEPLGWWDANGNSQWDDMLVLQPGQTINNANVTLYPGALMGEEGIVRDIVAEK